MTQLIVFLKSRLELGKFGIRPICAVGGEKKRPNKRNA